MTSTPPDSVQQSPSPQPPRRLFTGRALELFIAVGVLVISVISLFVAFSSNRTQERMLAASVWPSLQFGTSNVGEDGVEQLTFDLLNRGVGPARLRWSEISVGGEPVQSLREFLGVCCKLDKLDAAVSSGLKERVLGAGEWMRIVRIPREGLPEGVWEALDAKRNSVRYRACYCSVLDDCWVLDSDQGAPQQVDVCPVAPGKLWDS